MSENPRLLERYLNVLNRFLRIALSISTPPCARRINLTGFVSIEMWGRSTIYTGILKSHEFQISCSAKGNPNDNAFVESFMKTLKRDEVYLKKYRTYLDVIDNLPRFIEDVYNRKRLHSGLDYCPPEEYENQINQGASRTKLKL